MTRPILLRYSMSSDLQNDLHFSDVYLKSKFNFSEVHERMNNKGSVPFTVNLEIFARVLYSQNFANAKFCENKILAKC